MYFPPVYALVAPMESFPSRFSDIFCASLISYVS